MQEYLHLSLELYLIKNGCKCLTSWKLVLERKRGLKRLFVSVMMPMRKVSVCVAGACMRASNLCVQFKPQLSFRMYFLLLALFPNAYKTLHINTRHKVVNVGRWIAPIWWLTFINCIFACLNQNSLCYILVGLRFLHIP